MLLLVLVLLVGVRLPLWWLGGAPLSVAELRQQLIGERLNDGLTLYRDLFTWEAPLSAYLWELLDVFGGRSWLLYRVVAATLLVGQAIYFNYVLDRRGALAEKGWLPALLYGLAGAVWWELDTLTPLLWGQTFLLAAFANLVTTSREGYDNRSLFQAGFLLGLAALCHPPLLLFLPVGVLAVIFFAANAFRSFLLLLVGVSFPYAALSTIYLYTGALDEFRSQHLHWATLLPFHPQALVPAATTWRVLAVPLILLGVAAFRSLERGGQLNYQVRFRQVMLVWLGSAGLMMLGDRTFSPASLLPLLPPLAYFGPALIGRGLRQWVNEGLFLAAVVGIGAIRYAVPLHLTAWLPAPPAGLLADIAPGHADPARGLRGQRVLLLGAADPRVYRHNRHASAYLDWSLARLDFDELATYPALYRLHERFRRERPTWLLDPRRRYVAPLRQRLPAAFGRYHEVRPGLWRWQ